MQFILVDVMKLILITGGWGGGGGEQRKNCTVIVVTDCCYFKINVSSTVCSAIQSPREYEYVFNYNIPVL